MDGREFLMRVVAPGAYYAFAYTPPGGDGPRRHKFFPQDELDKAVAWLRATAQTTDVYHAVGSFKTNRNRKQENAEALRCFFYDADIHREGDGKALEDVWASQAELVGWLAEVKDRLPIPNLWISSGYGIHLYWVLDEAIPAAEWRVHAKAFKGLLASVGARGDIGISDDSARILRPLETFNYKVPNSPAPVRDITPQKVQTQVPARLVTKDFLARLTPGVTSLGPRPNRPVNTGSLAAAKAGLPKPPPADFALIATRCLQVQKSLEEEGEHDRYLLWRQMLNLAYFCGNQQAAHDLGRKGINYSEADTDAKFERTEDERGGKDFGAPTCASLNSHRGGVCQNCPYWTKINSPFSLGRTIEPVDTTPPTEPPRGYRHTNWGLEFFNYDKDVWELLTKGSISNVQLLYTEPDIYEFMFDYTLSGHVTHVRVRDGQINGTADPARKQWADMGLAIDPTAATKFSRFVMAWINKLKEAKAFIEAPASFGWVADKQGGYKGVAIAGTYYRADGTEGVTQLGDQTINDKFQPTGDMAIWRQACEYVIENRPELQTIVGVSFAAPLIQLIGESAAVLNVWSQRSGVRKTSTFRVALAAWCNPITGMYSLDDTQNSVYHTLATTRIMLVPWDEVHTANKEQQALLDRLIFGMVQGKGKSRLGPTIEQREVGFWRAPMITSANRPLTELIQQQRAQTDAGPARILEYSIEPFGGSDTKAATTVQMVESNYGLAGREYIKWVVQHLNETEAILKKIREQIKRDVNDEPDERFIVALIQGTVSAAYIANKIGLVSLNWKGIYEFLKLKMISSRSERRKNTPTDEATWLSMTFDDFYNDHIEPVLKEQTFSKVGRRKNNLVKDRPVRSPILSPRFPRVLIHVGIDDKELRFDCRAFETWCKFNRQSPDMLYRLMERLWGAELVRLKFCPGTDWETDARVRYYKIMLITPELESYLKKDDPNTSQPASNVVPFPAAE